MIVPTWFSVAAFLVAAIAGGLACLLLVRRQTSSSHRGLAALLGATALTHLANGLGLLDEAHALLWRRMALAAELIQPAALLYVGLAFLNPAERGEDSSPLWRARMIGVVGLLLALLTVTDQVFVWRTFDDGIATIALASWGRVPYVFVVIAMALGLAQLELVLRASREPVRHRLKFIVIGLGGLAGYQIYQASQMLLFPIWRAEHVLVSSVVTAMALCSDRLWVGTKPIARSPGQYLCVPTGPVRISDVHRHWSLSAHGRRRRRMDSPNQSTVRGWAQRPRGVWGPGGVSGRGIFEDGAGRDSSISDEKFLSIEIRLSREMASGHRSLSGGSEARRRSWIASWTS